MKIKTKQAISLVVVLFMILGIVGCGKTSTEYSTYYEVLSEYGENDNPNNSQAENTGETENKDNENNDTQTQATTGEKTWKQVLASMPSDLKGTTITIGNWNDISDVPGLKGVILKFEQQTGIKVVWKKMSYTTYASELAAMVASQNAPDVIRVKSVDPAVMVSLQPLSNTGYDFSTSEWDQTALEWYSIKGKQYAVNMQNTLLQQPSCMIYNTKLISKYDLDDPYTLWKQGKWTWNNFMKICKEYKDVCGEGCYPFSQYCGYDYAMITGTGAVDWDGNKFVSHMGDSKFLEACLVDADMLEKGYTSNIHFDRNGFEQGKVLFFCESLIGARTTHYYFADMKTSNSIDAVPYPTVEGKDNYQYYGEYEAYAVPKGAKNIKAVPYFLRYYLDSQNYNEKTFFSNIHMLEVHKAMRKNTKIYWCATNAVFTEDTGMASGTFVSKLHNTKAAQMKTVLDEYSSVANAAVAASNKIMDKVG